MKAKTIKCAAVATVLSVGALAGAMPKTATLIPAPREIRATGGEYWDKKPPKLEKVAGLPPEGYELSITTNGITIRHSDDAGAFYAQITLFHSGRWDSKAKCKVYPCLEIRDWPQFRWRGVHLDDSHCYFDARQGLAEDPNHYFGSAVTTLKKVYQFDPYEGVEPAARKNVVGGQCCNWSTHTFCLEGLEWKM